MTEENAYLPIWAVTEPSEQTHAPEWMSFHVYKEALRCPLSVSLQRSSYKQLWDGYGYPSRPSAAAVSGIVVHDAAETVLKKLVQAGVSSLMDPKAMSVLKEQGGFTKVLERSLNTFFADQIANPRFEQFRNDLHRNVKQKIPQMRATLQALLVSQVWTSSTNSTKDLASDIISIKHEPPTKRFALGTGTSVEIDLEDKTARWRGRADVIEVSQNGCSITDLKSGSASKDHEVQLLVYTMLWREDQDRNPSLIPVMSLAIVYADGKVDVPIPDAAAMQTFREELISSSGSVRKALDSPTVPANPTPDNCRYCPVKLLCGPHWRSLLEVGADGLLSSNEVSLIESRGDRAWLARVTASPILPVNQQVVIRNYEGGKPFWNEMKAGLSVRLTDGRVSEPEADEIPVINLSMMSEALFVR
jgi:CRISPR/Cas system-associated exonuclease Cas4 (RecB family)